MKTLNLFATLIFLGFAATTLEAQSTYALIVGISQYKEMPALQYADRDAIAFAEFVKSQGVPDQNISLFLNEDATRMNIVDELYRLSRTLKPQDRFYFYFGGHGDLEAKIGYENAMLLLHGSFKTGYFQGKEFLQLSELKTWLTALSKTQTQVVFIADACHSGGLIGGSEGQSKTQRALQESWANVTKILSSQANEFSLEGQQWGGGRGLFSFHLVNGLTGRADVNKNKLVSVKELDEYLRYHVRREASPNVQTPLVVGEPTLALSKSSASGLAQLAIAEKRNFPVISAVNFKGANPIEKMLAKLDTGIVELYKRFSKAVKERRLADHDNAQDNALLHFRAMAGRNIPDTLLNIMKRNLGAALMERELQIMQNPREKGQGPTSNDKILELAIQNLETTINLFGPNHYFYSFLQARKMVLQSMRRQSFDDNMNNPIDRVLEAQKAYQSKKVDLLKGSLILEPNMVSTFQMLAISYQATDNRDSGVYYLEKVVELLPNHAQAFINIGLTYHNFRYKDAEGLDAPHPKAIYYLKKAIELDSTARFPYTLLANNYRAVGKDNKYRDLVQAVYYHKKLLGFIEKPLDTLKKRQLYQAITKANFLKNSIAKTEFSQQLQHYAYLAYMYQKLGDSTNAKLYQDKLQAYCYGIGSYQAFMNVAGNIYGIFNDFEEDLSFLNGVKDYYHLAQKRLEKDMAAAYPIDLPYIKVMYYEILKALGAHHRNIQAYDQAELYLQQAMSYSIEGFKAENQLKLTGGSFYRLEDRLLTAILPMVPVGANNFHYRVEPHEEMFLLNLEQNKMEAAMQWLEKALQVSVSEKGNDTSGTPTRNSILRAYKNIDVNAFNALYEKYFPKTDEKK